MLKKSKRETEFVLIGDRYNNVLKINYPHLSKLLAKIHFMCYNENTRSFAAPCGYYII